MKTISVKVLTVFALMFMVFMVSACNKEESVELREIIQDEDDNLMYDIISEDVAVVYGTEETTIYNTTTNKAVRVSSVTYENYTNLIAVFPQEERYVVEDEENDAITAYNFSGKAVETIQLDGSTSFYEYNNALILESSIIQVYSSDLELKDELDYGQIREIKTVLGKRLSQPLILVESIEESELVFYALNQNTLEFNKTDFTYPYDIPVYEVGEDEYVLLGLSSGTNKFYVYDGVTLEPPVEGENAELVLMGSKYFFMVELDTEEFVYYDTLGNYLFTSDYGVNSFYKQFINESQQTYGEFSGELDDLSYQILDYDGSLIKEYSLKDAMSDPDLSFFTTIYDEDRLLLLGQDCAYLITDDALTKMEFYRRDDSMIVVYTEETMIIVSEAQMIDFNHPDLIELAVSEETEHVVYFTNHYFVKQKEEPRTFEIYSFHGELLYNAEYKNLNNVEDLGLNNLYDLLYVEETDEYIIIPTIYAR